MFNKVRRGCFWLVSFRFHFSTFIATAAYSLTHFLKNARLSSDGAAFRPSRGPFTNSRRGSIFYRRAPTDSDEPGRANTAHIHRRLALVSKMSNPPVGKRGRPILSVGV